MAPGVRSQALKDQPRSATKPTLHIEVKAHYPTILKLQQKLRRGPLHLLFRYLPGLHPTKVKHLPERVLNPDVKVRPYPWRGPDHSDANELRSEVQYVPGVSPILAPGHREPLTDSELKRHLAKHDMLEDF